MLSLRVICFDLDDTLWNLALVIARAEQLLYKWLHEYSPRVTAAYSPADLSRLRLLAASRWPEFQHDLSELRIRTLRQIADATGYDEAMVTGAYSVFIDARNNVQLYDDVVPVLQPHEILHVGDHPENDIAAARDTGMKTAWINRKGVEWPLTDTRPHYEIENLNQLQQLLQL